MPKMTITNRATEGEWKLQGRLVWPWVYRGGGQIAELMNGGLRSAPAVKPDTQTRLDEKVERTAAEAAKPKFVPEFINRANEEDGLLYA
jgi:hypothetical protein